MRSGRFDAEYGVTIVEATFVIPLLFFLVLGMLDIGMWEFQTTQASNARPGTGRAAAASWAKRTPTDAALSPHGRPRAATQQPRRWALSAATLGSGFAGEVSLRLPQSVGGGIGSRKRTLAVALDIGN